MTRHLWTAAIAAGVLALYLLRLDPAAGLYVDDAWYIVLAKALAQGDGYTLISSAAVPILPAFPPGFPLLLSPVFADSPDFPGNVMWLKAVSIAAMFGVAATCYLFLVRYRAAPVPLAAAVALITVVTPAFVFLATSTVMAECVFTLSQLGMALAVERAVRLAPSWRSRLGIGLGAVLGVATLLIRTAGLAPLLAGAMYLALKRGWRSAAGFACVAAVCYLPWALYANAHRPTTAARLAHGGSVAFSYGDLLAMRQGGVADGGRIGFEELPARAGANLINVFGRDIGALILPAAYRGASESGQEAFALSGETGLRAGSMGGGTAILWVSSALSAIAVLGFVRVVRGGVTVAEFIVPLTIVMVVLVPARTFRYILPLTPFVVAYFFRGIEAIAAQARGAASLGTRPEVRIGALCMLGLVSMEHAQYVWQMRYGPQPPWLRDHEEVRAVSDWMDNNLTAPGAVAATNPGLVYLLAGRKTVAFTNAVANWPRWQALGVRYAVAFHLVELPPTRLGYRLLYRSPRLGLWVIELPAPPQGLTKSASRP